MFKATPGVHRTVRQITQDKTAAAGFDGPDESNYDAQAGAPKGAAGVKGTYECSVHGTLTQTPIPSKSVKDPIK